MIGTRRKPKCSRARRPASIRHGRDNLSRFDLETSREVSRSELVRIQSPSFRSRSRPPSYMVLQTPVRVGLGSRDTCYIRASQLHLSSRLYAKDNPFCIARRRRSMFMLSKPVAGVTSLGATSEAATLQEIQTGNISLTADHASQKTRWLWSRQDRASHELYRTVLVMT